MARLPFDPFPSVSPAGAPSNDYLQVEPAAAKALQGLGQAASQGGKEEFSAAMDVAGFHAQVAADDAYNQFQTSVLDATYGTPDKPGFYSLRGADALNAYPALRDTLDAARQRIGDALPNPATKYQFNTNSRRLLAITLEGAGNHYNSELATYGVQTQDAATGNAVRNAGVNYNDEAAFNQSMSEVVKATTRTAQIQGWSDDVFNQKLDEARSKVVSARVQGLMTRDPKGAYAFLLAHADVVDASTFNSLTTALRPLVVDDDLTIKYSIGGNGTVDTTGFARGSANLAKPGPTWGTPGTADFETQHLTTIKSPGGQAVTVNKVSAAAFSGFLTDLAAAGYKIDDVQGYNDRSQLGGGPSQHAFGNAIDINPDRNPAKGGQYGGPATLQTDLPANVADIAAKWGLTWGGDWRSLKDPMHFEFAGTPGGATPAPGTQPSTQRGTPPIPSKAALLSDAATLYPNDPEMQRLYISRGNSMINEITAVTAVSRSQLTSVLPDIVAAAEAGNQSVAFPETQVATLLTPQEADHWRQEFAVAQHVGEVMRGAEWASPDEIAGMEADLAAGQGVLSDMLHLHTKGATTGPGVAGTVDQEADDASFFRLRAGAAARLQAEIDRRTNALVGANADPAAYAASNPKIKAALAAVDPKNPHTFELYADAQLGLQSYLGVPDSQQHVITRGAAIQIADQVTKATDAQATLTALQKQFGASWQHVFNDMVTLGRLPPAYQSVAALDDPRDAALLARGLNEVKSKPDGTPGRTWDDILGNAGNTSVALTIRQSIRTDPTVTKFEQSLAASGASASQIDAIVGSVETLAYAKRFYDGDASAAQHAITSFTGRYEFLPNGGARIPTAAVQATTATARNAVEAITSGTISVPAVFGQAGGPTADDYVNVLKAAPTWITSPKEDALWLMDGQGRIVRDKSGNPFAVPFTTTMPAPVLGTSDLDRAQGTGAFAPDVGGARDNAPPGGPAAAAPTAVAPAATPQNSLGAFAGAAAFDYSVFGASASRIQGAVDAAIQSGLGKTAADILSNPNYRAAILQRIPEAQAGFDKIDALGPQTSAASPATGVQVASSDPQQAAQLYVEAQRKAQAQWDARAETLRGGGRAYDEATITKILGPRPSDPTAPATRAAAPTADASGLNDQSAAVPALETAKNVILNAVSGSPAAAAQAATTVSTAAQKALAYFDNQGSSPPRRASPKDKPAPVNRFADFGISTEQVQKYLADKATFAAKFKEFFDQPPTANLTPAVIAAAVERAKARDVAAAKTGDGQGTAPKSGRVETGYQALSVFLELMLVVAQGVGASDAKKGGGGG